MARLQAKFLLVLLLSICLASESFNVALKQSLHRPSTKRGYMKRAPMTMYVPPSSPTSQTPPMTAQKILNTPGTCRADKMSREQRRSNSISLSNSVLASCDTLPSFPTAHGLLSPETVMRMDKMTAMKGRSNELNLFLDTYRRHGPMSCLPYLSDPSVLPHLTEALRDIA